MFVKFSAVNIEVRFKAEFYGCEKTNYPFAVEQRIKFACALIARRVVVASITCITEQQRIPTIPIEILGIVNALIKGISCGVTEKSHQRRARFDHFSHFLRFIDLNRSRRIFQIGICISTKA